MVGSHGPSSGGQIIAIGIIRQATKNKVKALLLLVAPLAMERTQHAIDSAASARDACTRELTHVPIEAQLLAGHHIRGGYELAVDCATTRSSSRRSTRF